MTASWPPWRSILFRLDTSSPIPCASISVIAAMWISTIARRFTDRVVVRDWPGFAGQKNVAASLASHDWILSLDADEQATPALSEEIRTILSRTPTHAR